MRGNARVRHREQRLLLRLYEVIVIVRSCLGKLLVWVRWICSYEHQVVLV